MIARLCDKYDHVHKFHELITLHQRGSDLDGYMVRSKDLFAQVPNMSAQDSLYLGCVEPSVRVDLLVAAHVDTLKRALEETRIYANAHMGVGVLPSGRMETADDPMDLTSHKSMSAGDLASHPSVYRPTRELAAMVPTLATALLRRPFQQAPRSPAGSGSCYQCGLGGHQRRDYHAARATT